MKAAAQTLSSPAKINLFLYVLGKREDGYHDVATLMCPVGLCDEITLTFGHHGIRVTCSCPQVPQDRTNLAYRAAELFFECAKLEGKTGVAVHIDKRVPVQAGLGGGSSNAATVLLGLNRWFGNPFGLETLARMGRGLGADVPFFVWGKPGLATGIGDRIEPVLGLPPLHAVLVYPGFGISTAAVYGKLNLALTKCEKKHKHPSLPQSLRHVAHLLHNDLEKVAVADHPEIEKVKKDLIEAGAQGALMSGSGSTVFGLFSERRQAQRAVSVLQRNDRWRVFLADLLCP